MSASLTNNIVEQNNYLLPIVEVVDIARHTRPRRGSSMLGETLLDLHFALFVCNHVFSFRQNIYIASYTHSQKDMQNLHTLRFLLPGVLVLQITFLDKIKDHSFKTSFHTR